jgi:3-oxoadipate CoA-transferase alpha subunit
MLNKVMDTVGGAIADLAPGSVVLISGFGMAGIPVSLVDALADSGVADLTIVANNAGAGDGGIARLLKNGQVAKIICSYPRSQGSVWFERRFFAREVQLELVPQGTLAERIRAGAAGIAGFYTRSGVGTAFAEGRETRIFDGQIWLLERAIKGDFALIRTHASDPWGNSVYRKTARNFGPTMAGAATVTVAEADQVVPLGSIDPEHVVTPGIYVARVVQRGT